MIGTEERAVLQTRLVEAPARIVADELLEPLACRAYLHCLSGARPLPDGVEAQVGLGPRTRPYVARIARRSDGRIAWTGPDSSGEVRCSGVDADRTLIEVELRWHPRSLLGTLVARAEWDSRRIAADLSRLAAVAESAAAEERLGPLSS